MLLIALILERRQVKKIILFGFRRVELLLALAMIAAAYSGVIAERYSWRHSLPLIALIALFSFLHAKFSWLEAWRYIVRYVQQNPTKFGLVTEERLHIELAKGRQEFYDLRQAYMRHLQEKEEEGEDSEPLFDSDLFDSDSLTEENAAHTNTTEEDDNA